jgi:hypothetical protein
MSNSAVAIIAGALSGGFALAGVGVSNWLAGRRERAAFRRETALELAGMERLVWGESWVELEAHLQRQEVRLAEGNVPSGLIRDFHDISVGAWRDRKQTIRESGGERQGMGSEFIDARRAVHEAARAYLLGNGSRASRAVLRIRAADLVEDALPEDRHAGEALRGS